jgi:hypothetical protein
MFVVRLVRTDGVIARPLAIVETLAERKGAFVKGGSYRHGSRVLIIANKCRFSGV